MTNDGVLLLNFRHVETLCRTVLMRFKFVLPSISFPPLWRNLEMRMIRRTLVSMQKSKGLIRPVYLG